MGGAGRKRSARVPNRRYGKMPFQILRHPEDSDDEVRLAGAGRWCPHALAIQHRSGQTPLGSSARLRPPRTRAPVAGLSLRRENFRPPTLTSADFAGQECITAVRPAVRHLDVAGPGQVGTNAMVPVISGPVSIESLPLTSFGCLPLFASYKEALVAPPTELGDRAGATSRANAVMLAMSACQRVLEKAVVVFDVGMCPPPAGAVPSKASTDFRFAFFSRSCEFAPISDENGPNQLA